MITTEEISRLNEIVRAVESIDKWLSILGDDSCEICNDIMIRTKDDSELMCMKLDTLGQKQVINAIKLVMEGRLKRYNDELAQYGRLEHDVVEESTGKTKDFDREKPVIRKTKDVKVLVEYGVDIPIDTPVICSISAPSDTHVRYYAGGGRVWRHGDRSTDNVARPAYSCTCTWTNMELEEEMEY